MKKYYLFFTVLKEYLLNTEKIQSKIKKYKIQSSILPNIYCQFTLPCTPKQETSVYCNCIKTHKITLTLDGLMMIMIVVRQKGWHPNSSTLARWRCPASFPLLVADPHNEIKQ